MQRSRQVFGPDHARTLWAAAALSTALVQRGEAASARTLGEDTLQRLRRVFGPDHATSLSGAAALTHALALLGEAEPPWVRTPCRAAAGCSARTTRPPCGQRPA